MTAPTRCRLAPLAARAARPRTGGQGLRGADDRGRAGPATERSPCARWRRIRSSARRSRDPSSRRSSRPTPTIWNGSPPADGIVGQPAAIGIRHEPRARLVHLFACLAPSYAPTSTLPPPGDPLVVQLSFARLPAPPGPSLRPSPIDDRLAGSHRLRLPRRHRHHRRALGGQRLCGPLERSSARLPPGGAAAAPGDRRSRPDRHDRARAVR